MTQKNIWFSGVGELDAPYNNYSGRWKSLISTYGTNAKIITTSFIHSKQVDVKNDIFIDQYIILNCGGYIKKRGIKRVYYHLCFNIKFLFYLVKNKNDVDIIVFNAVPHSNIIGMLLAYVLGKIVVLDVRDLWLDDTSNKLMYLFTNFNRIIFRLQKKMAKFIFVTSRKYFKHTGSNANWIPLGFDELSSKNQYEVFKAKKIVGYIGNESMQYNLWEASNKVIGKGFEFEIVGSYSSKFKDKMYKEFKNKISFLGYIDDSDKIREVTNRWLFGVLPNLAYSQMGLPSKVFDYIKFDLPILYINNHTVKADEEIKKFILEGWGIFVTDYKSIDYEFLRNYIIKNKHTYCRKNLNKMFIEKINYD